MKKALRRLKTLERLTRDGQEYTIEGSGGPYNVECAGATATGFIYKTRTQALPFELTADQVLETVKEKR